MYPTSHSSVQAVAVKSPGNDKYKNIPDTHREAVEGIERIFELDFERCWNSNCSVDFYPKGERCSCED